MRCYYHPDIESANSCVICGKLLCASCSHTIKGRVYCQDCLVAGTELASLAGQPRFRNYSPARAAFFGLVPGLGAVYNREYSKAAIHFSIFAALVILADHGPGIFVLGAIAFYFFTIIDAYRSAQAILRWQLANPEVIQNEEEDMNLPVWGGILILLGVVFFLNNMGVFRLGDVARFAWPLIFIFLGVYFILDYYLRGKGRTERRDAAELRENQEDVQRTGDA